MAKKKMTLSVKFPMSILKPIGDFLAREAKKLERRKKELSQTDPFIDTSRLNDNAAPDTDAAEQFGHQRVTALQAQIDRRLIQIKKSLTRLKIGKYGICEVCGKMIDTDRLMVMPETTLCAECAKKKEE
jgi:RNA polymerase-binding transcription factor DksA